MDSVFLNTFPGSPEASERFFRPWTLELNERASFYAGNGSSVALMSLLSCLLQGIADNEEVLFLPQPVNAERGGAEYLALLTRPCEEVSCAAALPIRSLLSQLAAENLAGLIINPAEEAVPVEREFLLASINLYDPVGLQNLLASAMPQQAEAPKPTFAFEAAEAEVFEEELSQKDLYSDLNLDEDDITLQVSRPMLPMDFDIVQACLQTLLLQDPNSYFVLGFDNPLGDDGILSLKADRCGFEYRLKLKLALSGFDPTDSLLMEGSDFTLEELIEIFSNLGLEGKTSQEIGLLDRLTLI